MMNETDDALSAVGAAPLSNDEYAVPSWAEKIVDQIAQQSREPSFLEKAFRYGKLFAILFAFCGVTFFLCLILYWFGEPYGTAIVQFKDGIHVLNQDGSKGPVVVHPGDEVLLQGSYCKTRDTLTTVIHREFHDELVYELPSVISNVPKGCGANITTPLQIPKNLPPDEYTIVFRFDYQINPLKTQSYEFETNRFTVVAPSPPTPPGGGP